MSEDDVLARAKTLQRYVANQTTVSIKMALLEDLIAEIEALRARLEPPQRPFDPVSEGQEIARMANQTAMGD